MKWLDPGWYRYLWRRTGADVKVLVAVGILAIMALGGYLASSSFEASASSTTDAYLVQSVTVTKIVTIKKNGKTTVKRYPVVHTVRIKAQAVTVSDLRTVTTPQGVKTIPVVRVKYVPKTSTVDKVVNHVVTDVVTKHGKTTTVVQNHQTTVPVTVQQTVPVTVSQTQTQVVTNERTLTNVTTQQNTVTNEQTTTAVTTRPVTTTIQFTVTAPTQTVTTTRTVTSTRTDTVTQTETVTRTTTLPGLTTTVLVTTVVTTTVPK